MFFCILTELEHIPKLLPISHSHLKPGPGVSAWALGQTLPSTISNDVISTMRAFLSFQILSSTQCGGLSSLLQVVSSLGCWFSLEFLCTPLTYPIWPPSLTPIL